MDELITKTDELESSSCDKNILDLNDDCLREIIEYFDLCDYCAFGSTCSRLREVTQAHIASNPEIDKILLWNFSDKLSMVNVKHKVNTMEFLRMFGPFIKSITMMGIKPSPIFRIGHNKKSFIIQREDQDRIFQLLVQYCTAMLKELELWNYFLTDETALVLQPLLRNLHRLRIEETGIGDLFLKMLPHWAPELRELEFDSIRRYGIHENVQFVCLQQKFPHLEVISLNWVKGIANEDIEELLKWNPQLKHIEVRCDNVNRNIFDIVFKHVPNIEYVRVHHNGAWIEWEK